MIEALADDPRPVGIVALEGSWRGYYRVRSGNYRVTYGVEDAVLIVVVVKVGDRRDIY